MGGEVGLQDDHAYSQHDQHHAQDVERQASRPVEGQGQAHRPKDAHEQCGVEELDGHEQYADYQQNEGDVRVV